MPFTFEPLRIRDLLLVTSRVFTDDRGSFLETYVASAFAEQGIPSFVQDNRSRSTRGVLRGMHYQLSPHAQGKLVSVVDGAVFDVAVDLRRSSPTFGEWVGQVLTAQGNQMLYVPAGFAHGFLVTSDAATVLYKATAEYAPAAERAIRWDDPAIGIAWPDVGAPYVVSHRDRTAPLLADAATFDAVGSA